MVCGCESALKILDEILPFYKPHVREYWPHGLPTTRRVPTLDARSPYPKPTTRGTLRL